ARVRSQLFSELGRANLVLRKAVDWRLRLLRSIHPAASAVFDRGDPYLPNGRAKKRVRQGRRRGLALHAKSAAEPYQLGKYGAFARSPRTPNRCDVPSRVGADPEVAHGTSEAMVGSAPKSAVENYAKRGLADRCNVGGSK